MRDSYDVAAGLMDRRSLLQGMALLGGLALAPRIARAQAAKGTIMVRWLGGGVVELATPDYKQMAYIDCWIWRNAGWSHSTCRSRPSTRPRRASCSTSSRSPRRRCWCS